MSERTTFTLTVRDMGNTSVPVPRRLARLLKLAKRYFQLECRDVREVATTTALTPAGQPDAARGIVAGRQQ